MTIDRRNEGGDGNAIVDRLLNRLHSLVRARQQRREQRAGHEELTRRTTEIDQLRWHIAAVVRESLGDRARVSK